MGDVNSQVVVPGGAIPTATPQFAGGAAPVAGGGGTPDPASQAAEMAKKIMATLAQNSQRKQFAGTPVPSAVPGMQDPNAARQIGMDTANPNAWGKQRLMNGIATNISNAVAKQKQQKLLKAEEDWTYMGSALNELYAAQASGDPKAVAAAQQKVDVVLGDPKKLKEMAKALNQDWLNPEKTTVYREALKKVTAKAGQDAQNDAQKQQAATGLKGLFQKLLQKNQQPQLSPEQQKAMSAEIQAKAPTTAGSTNVQDLREGALAELDIAKASKQLKENYQFQVGSDGKLWAINKTNHKDAFVVTDKQSGENVTATPKGKSGIFSVKGLPVGVYHGGVPVVPGQEGWTKADQQVLDAGMHKAELAQQLRINPIVADQVGAPPNPDNYKLGTADPKYAADLKDYAQRAEKIDDRMKSASAIARAKAQNDYKIVEVTDFDEEGKPFTHYTTGAAALAGGLGSATTGGKNLSRTQQIEDIEVSSQKLRDALGKVGNFSPAKIALMQKALQEGDEGVASAEMQAAANDALNDDEFQAILWIKHLNERAMSLRNIAGMGQGAQDLRNAIRSMLPNIGTGSPERMKTMLDAFDNQVGILKKGVPTTGGQKAAQERQKQTATPAPKAGEIQFTPITQ